MSVDLFNLDKCESFKQPKKHQDTLRSDLEQPFAFRITKSVLKEDVRCAGSWFYMDLEIPVSSSDYQSFFESVDASVVQHVYDNRLTWFQQDMPIEMIQSFYEPSLKSNLLRLKIPAVNKQPEIPVRVLSLFESEIGDAAATESEIQIEQQQNQGRQSETKSSLAEFQEQPVTFVVEITSIRFLKTKFSIDYKLKSVTVRDTSFRETKEGSDEQDEIKQKHLQMLTEVKQTVEEQLQKLSQMQEILNQKYSDVIHTEKKLLEDSIVSKEAADKILSLTNFERDNRFFY